MNHEELKQYLEMFIEEKGKTEFYLTEFEEYLKQNGIKVDGGRILLLLSKIGVQIQIGNLRVK